MFDTIRKLLKLNPIRLVANASPGILSGVFGRSRNPMVNGDREKAVRNMWPAHKWPTLYKDIHADIRRPVIWDGRVLGGYDVPWLAGRHLSDDVVRAAVYNAGMNALRVSSVVVLALAAWSLYYPIMYGAAFRPFPTWAQEAGAWHLVAGHYVLIVLDLVFGLVNSAISLGASLALFFVAAWIFGFWRSLKKWWDTVSGPLRSATRDANIAYKMKSVTRQIEYEGYCRQVETATVRMAKWPVIRLGTGTGLFRSRGDMTSPSRGQDICIDRDGLSKHIMILGKTGSMKTRLAIKPFFKNYVNAAWPEGFKAGAYVTDGKGSLWRDLMPMVTHRPDVRVVGVAPDQYGVNLLAGMTPLEVSTVFKSVTGQISASAGGSTSGDDIWPESASLLTMYTAMLALVLENDEQTDKADDWQDFRPYSLLGIYRLASSEQMQKDAIDRITELGAEAGERGIPMSEELSQALSAALWFKDSWVPRAAETKGSIVMNVEQVLGKLFGAPDLSRRFFTGMFEDGQEIDVDHALNGGILMIAVGETQFGMAGKVVSCWIKSRLFIAARRREMVDPTASDRCSCAVIADEFQMLATQGAGADSDSGFWNVGRSTGVFLVCATQSLAALEQILGQTATANIVNNCNTKILLSTDEISTIEYFRKIVGELPRGFEAAAGFYATQGDREAAVPDVNRAMPKATWRQAFFPTWPSLPTHSMRSIFEFNKRNVIKRRDAEDGGMTERNTALAERVRVEDKNDRTAAEGLQWRSKVEVDDFMFNYGFGLIMSQRAGGGRTDICDLEVKPETVGA